MFKKILLKSLRFLAKKVLKKYHPQVIGITGSVGKTSAKEAIAMVLSGSFNVRKTAKNYNNEVGVPLTIFGIDSPPNRSFFGWLGAFWQAISLLIFKNEKYPEILVLEMGADKPGDIKYLVDIAPCNVGVLTFISHAHTEFFGSLKKIAQEKRNIITHLTGNGYALLNYDNDMVREEISSTKAQVITYGFKNGADMQASDVHILYDNTGGWPMGTTFKVSYQGNVLPVFLPAIAAEHLIPAALTGLAVGTIFGINLVDGAARLRNLKPLPGHMRLIPGIKKTMLIDDTYNSSPEAAKSALLTLANFSVKDGAERYAVLGDMLELGGETINAHREIGFKVAELGINFLVAVGEASKHTAAAAKEAGLEEHHVACFPDSSSAGRFLQDKLQEGDVALVKGSQSIRLEKMVKELMADPLHAKDLLVRQDGEWVNR
jgi:UDP-N-acetylmuramoyl-tripeptide--D-alanyl-D-alanine ligase